MGKYSPGRAPVRRYGARTTHFYVGKGDYMDVNSLTQLIGSLGFPIVMCIYLLLHQYKADEKHVEEMNKITEALNNNTVALTQLAERMK